MLAAKIRARLRSWSASAIHIHMAVYIYIYYTYIYIYIFAHFIALAYGLIAVKNLEKKNLLTAQIGQSWLPINKPGQYNKKFELPVFKDVLQSGYLTPPKVFSWEVFCLHHAR
jgi:hypothetical protein